MTRFSVTWEGICREENLSPSQIVELLEEESSELRSFQLNSIHSLAIMCDEPEDKLKNSSPPDTSNSNTEALRVVIEEVKSNDSNSTLEDISSIDDLNTTINEKLPNDDDDNGYCCREGEDEEDDEGTEVGEVENQISDSNQELPLEPIDKTLVKLALTEEEKDEELGVIMIPDHIVLTVDEKEKLFEEFETESSETVKIATLETEDETEEVVFEESSNHKEENDEGQPAQISSDEDDEPISISIDDPEAKIEPNKNENVAIQFIKNVDGAREFEMELSPEDAEFQSGESAGSDSSSRRASFEDDANDKLDSRTLDDALEIESESNYHKMNMPEPIASSETKNDGWSDSDEEQESGLTAKVTATTGGGGDDGWGQSDDEIEPPVKMRTNASVIASGDEKSKVMSDGSLCGDIRERGNIIDENRCSSSWNREKFQKRNSNRNDFDNRNNNYGNRESRDNQYRDNREGQRDNRQFDKAPGGSNRPRDQNRHGYDRFNRGGARDDFGRNDDRRRSFNSERSFHSYDSRDRNGSNDRDNRGDRYGDDQNGMRNDRQNNHYHRDNNHNRHDNRGDRFDSNFDSNRNNSYRNNNRGDYNRHYNNGQDSNNNYGGQNQRPYDNFNQRKFFDKENRDSMGMKDGQKGGGGRTSFHRDDNRRSFRDGGRDNGGGSGHGGRGHGSGGHMDREGDNLFGSHDNRNNRRTVRLNPNPNAKITFVNDHCTRGEMDPGDKMRNDLNFNQKEDIENEGW